MTSNTGSREHRSSSSRSSKSSPRSHKIDVAEPKEHHEGPHRGRAEVVEEYYSKLGDEGPGFFTYPNFLCYLLRSSSAMDGASFTDTFAMVAKMLLRLAEGPVFLADNMAFTADVLQDEFPELALFRLSIPNAFIESSIHPGIFIERRGFADLHLLSRMRRELRRTGLSAEQRSIDMVRVLLGLEHIPRAAH